MAGKVYEIGFKIAGDLSGKFTKSFKAANKTVGDFSNAINTLNKSAADVGAMKKLRIEIAENARAYAQARLKVAELGKQISATENPSKQLIASFNKQKAIMDKTRSAIDKQRELLRQLEQSTGLVGANIKALTKRENELAKAAERVATAQKKQRDAQAAMTNNNSTLSATSGYASAAGLAVGGGIAASVKEAMKLQDAMADVKKVVDFSGAEEMAAFQKQLEQMALKIPLSVDGLMQISAAAGQSGIAKEHLVEFTEQAAKMATAFDITADEAGEMMAKWASGMKLPLEQTYKLADSVNSLSNSNAATASQIGDVLKRFGAMGKTAGLNEKEVAAFAATVISAGATSETAATGIRAMTREMMKGEAMTGMKTSYFESLKIDPKQLQKDMVADAPKAIIATLEAIQKNVPADRVNEYLSQMFGDEAAVAVAPMMSNLDALKKNFSHVADETNYSGSMLKEFEARSGTASNSLQLMKNAVSIVAANIGSQMLPKIQELSKKFIEISQKVLAWTDDNQKLVWTFTKVAIGIAGIAAAALPMVAAIKTAQFIFAALKAPILAVNLSLKAMNLAIVSGTAKTKLGTVALKAYQLALKLLTPVQTAFNFVMNASSKAFNSLRAAIMKTSLAQKAQLIITKAATIAQKAFNLVMKANPYMKAIALIILLVGTINYLRKNWETIWPIIKQVLSDAWGGIQATFSNFISAIVNVWEQIKVVFSNLIGFVKNFVTGEWSAAWQNIVNIFGAVFSGIVGVIKVPINAVISAFNYAIQNINKALQGVKIPDWVPVLGGKKWNVKIPEIPQLAEGGIATSSTIANIGEGSEPEAVLPLSKLSNMLGNNGASRNSEINVSFSPTINVNGGSADVYGDVKNALDSGRLELEKAIKQIMAKERRLAFV